MTEAATALAALSDLDTWIVELAIPHHSHPPSVAFRGSHLPLATHFTEEQARITYCRLSGNTAASAEGICLDKTQRPPPLLDPRCRALLEVNTDFPIRTGQPVHFGKVRAVYWLTKADSARLIKDKGYDVAPDTDLAVMVIFETYPWVRFLTKMSTWQGKGSPVVLCIIT